jgi:hypothetical protein
MVRCTVRSLLSVCNHLFDIMYRRFLLPLWPAHTEPVHVLEVEFILSHPFHDITQEKIYSEAGTVRRIRLVWPLRFLLSILRCFAA